MEKIHQAIVLQPASPQNFNYLIFDQQLGTLEIRIPKQRGIREIPRSALIHYVPQTVNNRIVAKYVEIVATPHQWAINSIWFLHHLLELINFFVPRGGQAENIFSYVLIMYQPLSDDIDMFFFQKLFLCKFFILVGIYPEPINMQDRQFLSLLQSHQDYKLEEQKYVFLEKKMIQWLQECIRLHPHADRLRTMIMEPWYYEKKVTHY
jgi:hypothetical protein